MEPSKLLEIRLLPPLAIARLGAAADPMDNYDALVPEGGLGWRQLQPATTLQVDADSGEIARSWVPGRISFKDSAGLIRPVAPFLEVWALFEDQPDLVPLTVGHLRERHLEASCLEWSIQVANRKAFRRTVDPADRIECQVTGITGHERRALEGRCANFLEGAFIPFGFVQYLKPTDAFPEIRFRFTPAAGYVYGPEGGDRTQFHQAVYRKDGPWVNWPDSGSPLTTNPGQIYYGGDASKSSGFLDDTCDGIVDVVLDLGGEKLSSYARVTAGPPTFAPDSLPIRRVIDELEMALAGPKVGSGTNAEVQDIVRRAFETIRLMNTTVMNGNQVIGSASNMAKSDSLAFGRLYGPIMAPQTVDNLAIESIHENVFAALEGRVPPWFAETFRRYDEIGDLSDAGRRRMPAMMRGADGMYLTLTRRQLDLIRTAAGLPSLEKAATPEDPIS